MQISNDTVVSIDYTLTDEEQQVLDSSDGREPLKYLHGHGNIIPGLEAELEGKTEGDELEVAVPPERGYGEHDERLLKDVPRNMFEGVDEIKPGMQFQAQTQSGQTTMMTVAKVEGDSVTVDANHPLAGKTLHFKVAVREVRDATPEEIEHKHAH